MKAKIIRLSKALSNETVRRVPYIIVVLLVLVFVQSLQNNKVAKSNSVDSKALLMRVAALSQDNKNLTEANKKLTEQGVALASQSVSLNKCIANAFATYTQTLRPVQFEDIDACIFTSQSAQTSATPSQSAARPSLSSPGAPASSSSKSTPSKPQAQSNNSQSPQPQPKPNLIQRLGNGANKLLKSAGL